jgi:molybdopterin converting factor small subunit
MLPISLSRRRPTDITAITTSTVDRQHENLASPGLIPSPKFAESDRGAESRGAGDARVLVELFGVARLKAGQKRMDLPFAEARSLAQVIQTLAARHPALVGPVIATGGTALNDGYVFNLNGRDFILDPNTAFVLGDTVLLISAVAGGE